MLSPTLLLFSILIITIAMFLFGRWRHDMVAMAALLACTAAGLIEPADAFSGFSHPAVVTVACVLVLSYALQQTGAVDLLADRILPSKASPTVSITALVALAALLSSFMNNVGALALLMPIALQMANRLAIPPGQVLMPLAFATMLGGMTTLIGTPSNLLVSSFRNYEGHNGFAMFDFSPIGLVIAVVGVLFLGTLGWRLVPARERQDHNSFETGAYLTEARVPDESKAIGITLAEAEAALTDAEVQILGLIRNDIRLNAPNPAMALRANDVILLEADPNTLAKSLETLGLIFSEEKRPSAHSHEAEKTNAQPLKNEGADAATLKKPSEESKRAFSPELFELVVLPGSPLLGRSATNIKMRSRFHINLLAISRQSIRSRTRLRSTPLRIGDVLLVQGPNEDVSNFAVTNGCAPLASRPLRVPDRKKMWLSVTIMAAAIAGATTGLWSAALCFTLGVLLLLAFKVVPPRNAYTAIDWPVIVLLAALIPVGQAMETTGAAAMVANFMLDHIAQGHAVIALIVIMVATMSLSDLMNNAATAAVMSPIAIGTATQLGLNPDGFLMAVAIGASCAFLTPIAHQNNTLILGPGGFKFRDYWPLGLPTEILVGSITIPLILLVWPL